MRKETIYEELKDILTKIRPSADFSNINDDSQLVRDIGLDSLTILLLSLAIENKFGFKFEGNPKFTTVGEVVDYIDSHANATH
jgi:acyl carrier protein